MPELQWNIDQSIQYAEKLWKRLDEKGYGEPSAHEPRALQAYYDDLPAPVKAQFDGFWQAFDLKNGKQRAAMRWGQLGELSPAQFEHVLTAAGQTAAARLNLPPGQVPINAEGWLSQRRWTDAEATPTEKKQRRTNQKQRELALIDGELAHARQMLEHTGEPFWQNAVDKCLARMQHMRAEMKTT